MQAYMCSEVQTNACTRVMWIFTRSLQRIASSLTRTSHTSHTSHTPLPHLRVRTPRAHWRLLYSVSRTQKERSMYLRYLCACSAPAKRGTGARALPRASGAAREVAEELFATHYRHGAADQRCSCQGRRAIRGRRRERHAARKTCVRRSLSSRMRLQRWARASRQSYRRPLRRRRSEYSGSVYTKLSRKRSRSAKAFEICIRGCGPRL